MSDFDDLFGELRSMLQTRHATHWDFQKLIKAAFTLDESRYLDEWLPYLAANELYSVYLDGLDDLELFSRALPAGSSVTLTVETNRFPLDRLVESRAAACLSSLIISYKCKMSDARFAPVMESEHLGGLTRLDVGGNELGDGAMIALANARSIHKLEYLRLYHNNITATGARALAESPLMRHLTSLDISVNDIRDDGLTSIGGSPNLTNLRELKVFSNKIKRKGAEQFAAHNTLTSLTNLNISQNNIGNYGALALANCAALSNLTTLSVGRSRVNAKGVAYLRESEHLTKLEKLYTQ